jgi:hypothetical protein
VMSWQGHDIASFGNTIYAVFKCQPEMMERIYIVKSTDGGLTWGDTVRADGMNGPYSRFPSIAVTPAGNPAVMFMAFDSNWLTPTYVITNSPDGGQTFGMPASASTVGGSDVCDCCPGYMAINGNNQAAAWRRNSNNTRDMWAAVSTDGGSTFPTGIDVDNLNWVIPACPSSGPSPFLNGDTLITVFMSGASGDNRIYISTYSISTQTMGFSTQLATNISSTADQNYPFIAGNGDTLVVVWQQLNGSQVDTYYSWSLTGAAGLVNNAVLLNTSTSGNQENPHVAYSDGTFHFVWTDLASGNVKYKSATISPNGIAESSNNAALQAYPNPANEDVIVNLNAFAGRDAIVNVTDVAGRTVQSFSTNGAASVAIRHQDAGVYFIEVSDETSLSTVRVVFY